ncbi:hypothetical protein [Streptomyces sp. CB00455]|uniref:hypothetical protein n=1 Tax=Streptomyces sp. CB00455 TaxID=1703927 RepID=UPI0018FE421B|nr:hypothetical protein [Streptomyces sp. CB00455]
MRRLSKGAATGILALLLLGVSLLGLSGAVDGTTGSPHPEPGCGPVAFMSMTGVAPECR